MDGKNDSRSNARKKEKERMSPSSKKSWINMKLGSNNSGDKNSFSELKWKQQQLNPPKYEINIGMLAKIFPDKHTEMATWISEIDR